MERFWKQFLRLFSSVPTTDPERGSMGNDPPPAYSQYSEDTVSFSPGKGLEIEIPTAPPSLNSVTSKEQIFPMVPAKHTTLAPRVQQPYPLLNPTTAPKSITLESSSVIPHPPFSTTTTKEYLGPAPSSAKARTNRPRPSNPTTTGASSSGSSQSPLVYINSFNNGQIINIDGDYYSTTTNWTINPPRRSGSASAPQLFRQAGANNYNRNPTIVVNNTYSHNGVTTDGGTCEMTPEMQRMHKEMLKQGEAMARAGEAMGRAGAAMGRAGASIGREARKRNHHVQRDDI